MAVPKKPTKTCIQCDLTTVSIDKNFYATKNNYYFPDGKLPVCKACLWKKWEEEGFDSFLETMQMIDKPIFEDKLEMAKGDFKKYLTQIASLSWGKDKTFIDSTIFSEPRYMQKKKEEEEEAKLELKELTEKKFLEAQEIWGSGKTEEQYIWLTSEFYKYGFDPEVHSPSMETIIREVCLTQLDMRLRREKGLDVDKQVKTLNDLMTAAGIKPTQEGGTGNSEADAFSAFIKKLENERPVKDPHPDWADVDGIRKMIVTFFLHPWARMWNKQKESPYYEEAQEMLEQFTVKPRETDLGDENDN
jgi:hypothetical protein